jgi:hypothetical protein
VIFLTDAQDRENSRQVILAIGRLRNDLRGAIEWVLQARDRSTRERSFE